MAVTKRPPKAGRRWEVISSSYQLLFYITLPKDAVKTSVDKSNLLDVFCNNFRDRGAEVP